MDRYRLRSDLDRAVINGFALPLGIAPGDLEAPMSGYTIAYAVGVDDEPDTYSFYVAVSHERIAAVLHRVFDLLPKAVYGLVEISSRDAYRPIDVFIGREQISLSRFLETWQRCEPVLLEEGSIGAGANSQEPFVEIFLDQWKGLSIIVPLTMKEPVELMLEGLDLHEVPETWKVDGDARAMEAAEIRPVLDLADGAPDLDDLLWQLRSDWRLDLDVDPDNNVDEAGRPLGMTLWHAVVSVREHQEGSPEEADASVWATAGSLSDAEILIDTALSQWRFAEMYAIDRVAYDERPDELVDLAPRRDHAEVHLVQIETRARQPADEGREPGDG